MESYGWGDDIPSLMILEDTHASEGNLENEAEILHFTKADVACPICIYTTD